MHFILWVIFFELGLKTLCPTIKLKFFPLCFSQKGIQFYVLHLNQLFILTEFSYEMLALLLEKAMATQSITLAWKLPRTEEPGRLQSMGSLRVRHD